LDEEGKRVSKIAMVYGRLPPECRKEEARKFNANIAPYLVATNAIGMGLNLNIKKIIFAGIKRRNFKGEEVEL
jgi:ATP-dependent RNA helicase SUPV3L1/SUV3